MAKVSSIYVTDGDARLEIALFDHYKGGVYQTRGLARCTETGNVLVIYCAALGNGWGPNLFARRLADWNEGVLWPDGVERARFVSRGDDPAVPPFKVR